MTRQVTVAAVAGLIIAAAWQDDPLIGDKPNCLSVDNCQVVNLVANTYDVTYRIAATAGGIHFVLPSHVLATRVSPYVILQRWVFR